jgi:hypothetical protein
MSSENAIQFLLDITHKEEIRNQFNDVDNPDDFMSKCHDLGYDFNHEELQTVIHTYSKDVHLRRETGVWTWLRKVNWI